MFGRLGSPSGRGIRLELLLESAAAINSSPGVCDNKIYISQNNDKILVFSISVFVLPPLAEVRKQRQIIEGTYITAHGAEFDIQSLPAHVCAAALVFSASFTPDLCR